MCSPHSTSPTYYGHDQVLTRRYDVNYRFTPLESSWLNQLNIHVNGTAVLPRRRYT